VEPVEGAVLRTVLLFGQLTEGVRHGHVVTGAPFHEYFARGHVDLLHVALELEALSGPTHGREVGWFGAVGDQERGALVGEPELVEVRLAPVARLQPGDLAVLAIHDHQLAGPPTHCRLSLPPREHGLALVGLDPQVGGHGGAALGRRPHGFAPLVDDERPCLGPGPLGRQEHEARRGGGRGHHLDGRRGEVGARDVAL
jgi:hypothetical protein